MSDTPANPGIETWATTAYEVMVWEEGQPSAVKYEYPCYSPWWTMGEAVSLGKIIGEWGWEPISLSVRTEGIFFWRKEKRVWTFRRQRAVVWTGVRGGPRSGKLLPLPGEKDPLSDEGGGL